MHQILAGVAVVTFVLDQSTKWLAIQALNGQPPVDLVGSFLRLSLIRNAGAAFSLGTGATWVLTALAATIVVVLVRVSRKLGSLGWTLSLGLMLGGAVGNLTDRLLRSPGPGRGHVVDFIDYNGWFIGNAADIAIVGAGGLIALLALRGVGIDGRSQAQERSDA
ncbi:MAG TPA: signal peptidase II [Candidatus Lustribacter sp.]|nr:signal peptidase II [Candidatus Lustribacter sp.]